MVNRKKEANMVQRKNQDKQSEQDNKDVGEVNLGNIAEESVDKAEPDLQSPSVVDTTAAAAAAGDSTSGSGTVGKQASPALSKTRSQSSKRASMSSITAVPPAKKGSAGKSKGDTLSTRSSASVGSQTMFAQRTKTDTVGSSSSVRHSVDNIQITSKSNLSTAQW